MYLSAKGFGARGTARTNAGVHQDLIDHKKSDKNDTIPWGTKHLRYVADGAVTQLSWKDSSYCIFMSNMDYGVDTVYTKRRRPNETATCAKTARQPFRDQPEKVLPRPALIYFYNIKMNQVDRGDQMRATYPIQQRQQKGWKAMLYTIIGVVVVNSYLLSLHAPVPKENKFTDHLAFRQALYEALFQHSTGAAAAGAAESLPVAGPVNFMLPPGGTMPVIDDPDTKDRAELVAAAAIAAAAGKMLVTAAASASVEHQRVSMKRAACIMCKQAAAEEKRGIRGPRNRAFQALSPNIASKRKDKHIARAITGCSSCNVVLCSRKGCWEAFHSGVPARGWGPKSA